MIKILGHPALRSKEIKLVTEFGDKLKELTNDMINTMYKARGRGLSANQIGVLQSVFVMDGKYKLNDKGEPQAQSPVVCVNPVISHDLTNETISFREACLSIPGCSATTKRYDSVQLKYQDLDGETHEVIVDGLEAIIVQHEMGHLSGELYIDRLGKLNKDLVMKRFNKLVKRYNLDVK